MATGILHNADLHVHLGVDGANPGFCKTAKIACKALWRGGIFAIANTIDSSGYVYNRFKSFVDKKDCDTEWIDHEQRILYVPEADVYILGAEEVITESGHLLVVGVPFEKKMQKNDKRLSLDDTLIISKEVVNGINILVHSFSRYGIFQHGIPEEAILERTLTRIHGFETYNSSAIWIPGILPSHANEKASTFYAEHILGKYRVGKCAFSDSHNPAVIGRAHTSLFIEGEMTYWKLQTAVQDNTEESNLHCHLATLDALIHAKNMALGRAKFIKN